MANKTGVLTSPDSLSLLNLSVIPLFGVKQDLFDNSMTASLYSIVNLFCSCPVPCESVERHNNHFKALDLKGHRWTCGCSNGLIA